MRVKRLKYRTVEGGSRFHSHRGRGGVEKKVSSIRIEGVFWGSRKRGGVPGK